jgi:hypothetical protein
VTEIERKGATSHGGGRSLFAKKENVRALPAEDPEDLEKGNLKLPPKLYDLLELGTIGLFDGQARWLKDT